VSEELEPLDLVWNLPPANGVLQHGGEDGHVGPDHVPIVPKAASQVGVDDGRELEYGAGRQDAVWGDIIFCRLQNVAQIRIGPGAGQPGGQAAGPGGERGGRGTC
jgi:hypothetical protein